MNTMQYRVCVMASLGSERVANISNYIKPGKLWTAFTAEQRPVLLIDEIDKADIEFPNDLLHELDRMSFDVYETRRAYQCKATANSGDHLQQ